MRDQLGLPACARPTARRHSVRSSRRLEKPVLVLLDHRTKGFTPLRLAGLVDFLVFVDDTGHYVGLIEHSDHALYIGQQPGSEIFATVVVDAEGHSQRDEILFRQPVLRQRRRRAEQERDDSRGRADCRLSVRTR